MGTLIKKIPILISIAMLLLAIPDFFEYGYYMLMSSVVCITAIYVAYNAKKFNKQGWMWTMIIIAMLFNPLFPIYLGRIDWVLINLIVVSLFIASLIKIKGEKKDTKLNKKIIKFVTALLFFIIIISIVYYCYFCYKIRIHSRGP